MSAAVPQRAARRDRTTSWGPSPSPAPLTSVHEKLPPQLVKRARDRANWMLKQRRARATAFPGLTFGEPSWDILLDLFVNQTDGRDVSISSACIGSGCPVTTSLRHVQSMVSHGVLRRHHSVNDSRVSYVQLSDQAYQALAELLLRGEVN